MREECVRKVGWDLQWRQCQRIVSVSWGLEKTQFPKLGLCDNSDHWTEFGVDSDLRQLRTLVSSPFLSLLQ